MKRGKSWEPLAWLLNWGLGTLMLVSFAAICLLNMGQAA